MSKRKDDHCGCHNPVFKVEKRTQFSIIENSDTICDLLISIADSNINIDGFLYQNIECGTNLLIFAIGDENSQSECDLKAVKCILKNMDINYIENEALRVSTPSIEPGVLASLYCALSDEVKVYSSYNAEKKGIYFETSDNCKAAKIINSFD